MSPETSSFDWNDLTFAAYSDDLTDDQRWSTWDATERLNRGPEPWPDWLVTSSAAVDTDLGVLKSGKEADVFLLERAVPDDPGQSCLLAAKRYRGTDHRLFHRDTGYTEGRQIRSTVATRAMADRKSTFGKAMRAGLWVNAEWSHLKRLHVAGVPVPYPVQVEGNEILMEFISDGDSGAPRLHQLRPLRSELESLYGQLVDAMRTMAGLGFVHGDLSPYNILVADASTPEPRLVIIDVPQLVDLASNPNAVDFLHRDCTNMANWFTAKGRPVDAGGLLADLLGHAW
ncbi:MAG: RIO1 family regulatory kinase/ATPase [Propionicimonas sp.]|nr:RIO1 family regulatory kinase/ATPase [Propionicimonas sp.]